MCCSLNLLGPLESLTSPEGEGFVVAHDIKIHSTKNLSRIRNSHYENSVGDLFMNPSLTRHEIQSHPKLQAVA